QVPGLAAGGESPVSFSVSTEGHPGTFTLFVQADAAQQVAEAREDDNVASRSVRVEGALPDLAIDDLRVFPDPPDAGDSVSVSAFVPNRGERPPPPTLLRLTDGDPSADGVLLGEVTLPFLAPGATTTVTLPWLAGAEGNHVLVAIADPAFLLDES